MAPSRGRGRAAPSPRPAGSSSTRRSARRANDAAPGVYREMLADAVAADGHAELSDRPLKRRKLARPRGGASQERSADSNGQRPATAPAVSASGPAVPISASRQSALQTIEASSDDDNDDGGGDDDDDDDDDDDESDFGFEDVGLDASAASCPAADDLDGVADVSISIATPTPARRQDKAKRPATSRADKAQRLLVHKSHLLCLLAHCIYVNGWCNHEGVGRNLRGLLPAKVKSQLAPNPQASQFDRNRLFLEGLREAMIEFRSRFEVTASGMRKARWASEDDQGPLHADTEPMDRSDFIRASKRHKGSQDTGNQLFCALLRSIGVEARLVCSLQVLPFTSSASNKTTPIKPAKRVVYASDAVSERSNLSDGGSASDTALPHSRTLGNVPSARRRLGQPRFATPALPPPQPPPERRMPVQTLAYPVFWTEAFNSAHQKWLPVDPIVTGTCNKPTKLEPPSSYPLNQLTYVLAFESDGSARDVTRRYAKAYNAKTRRRRVEATEKGGLWLRKALRMLHRRGPRLDREQVEDAELAQKEAREGLPGNVQDFKDHPYYALERHLRRHEVVHPRRGVGKVNAGTAKNPRMETVFRRQDVQACRSAEKWYRLGREIKVGEQPLKNVPKRRGLARRAEDVEGEAAREEAGETPLYAAFQTALYVPPPVVRGRIPRNAFGNLDIYVPSMVPAGGAHVRHAAACEAARILGIDFVDAVTGFTFKGRHGTAVIEGGVVAAEFEDAVRAVCEGLEWQGELEKSRARSRVALAMWSRLIKAARVRERVRGAYGKEGEGVGQAVEAADDGPAPWLAGAEGEGEAGLITAGQYSLVELMEMGRTPKKRKGRRRYESEEGDEEEFAATPETGTVTASRRIRDGEGRVVDDEDSREGDEWVPDAATGYGGNYGSGGFLAEDASSPPASGPRTTSKKRVVHDEDDDDDDDDDEDEDEEMHHVPSETGQEPAGGGFWVENEGQHGEFLPDLDGGDNGGGGFLIDALDGSGSHGAEILGGDGGFLPEGSDAEHSGRGGFFRVDGADHKAHDKAADGSSGTHMSQRNPGGAEAISESAIERPPNEELQAEGIERTQRSPVHIDPQQDDPAKPSPDGAADAVSDAEESDGGSLLSHDPEDEDAEPDWLESD